MHSVEFIEILSIILLSKTQPGVTTAPEGIAILFTADISFLRAAFGHSVSGRATVLQQKTGMNRHGFNRHLGVI